jgi:hypothetical protein
MEFYAVAAGVIPVIVLHSPKGQGHCERRCDRLSVQGIGL